MSHVPTCGACHRTHYGPCSNAEVGVHDRPAAEDRAPLTPAEANAIDPRSFIGANPPADAPSAEDFAAIEGWVGCSRVYLTNEGRAALSRVLEAAKEAEQLRRVVEDAKQWDEGMVAEDVIARLRARVEKLEAALREIADGEATDGTCIYCDVPWGDRHMDGECPVAAARAALSEEGA